MRPRNPKWKNLKQIAPYENHKRIAATNKLIAEFDRVRVKDLMAHRVDRTSCGKKASPIDLSFEEFYQWLEPATEARDLYLAGKLSEEEALRIIHVPTIQELREGNVADLSSTQS